VLGVYLGYYDYVMVKRCGNSFC